MGLAYVELISVCITLHFLWLLFAQSHVLCQVGELLLNIVMFLSLFITVVNTISCLHKSFQVTGCVKWGSSNWHIIVIHFVSVNCSPMLSTTISYLKLSRMCDTTLNIYAYQNETT